MSDIILHLEPEIDDILRNPFGHYSSRLAYEYEHYDEFVDESGLPRPGNSPLVDILLRSDLYRYYIPLAGVTDKGEKTQRVHDPID